MKWSCLLLTACLGLSPAAFGGAPADNIIFDKQDAFIAAIPGIRHFGFEVDEGFPSARAKISSFDHGRVRVQTTFGDPGPAAIERYPEKNSDQVLTGISPDDFAFTFPFTLSFERALPAAGFEDNDLFGIEQAVITLTHVNGTTSTLYMTDADSNQSTPNFFGVISRLGITDIRIYAENPACDALFCFTPNSIDNLLLPRLADIDYSGLIDADDYFHIDNGFALGLNGFANGDINFDGVVDADDYFIIDSEFAAQGGVGLPAVPEPAPGLAGAAVFAMLSGRAARRRK